MKGPIDGGMVKLLAEYDARAPLRAVHDAVVAAAELLSLLRRDEIRECWVLWSETLESAQLRDDSRVSSPEKLIEKLAAAECALLAALARR